MRLLKRQVAVDDAHAGVRFAHTLGDILRDSHAAVRAARAAHGKHQPVLALLDVVRY